MSAEALSPRQFGPGGKYTTRFGTPNYSKNRYDPIASPEDVQHHASMMEKYGSKPQSIEAVHTASGRRVGSMNWFPGGSNPGSNQVTTSAANLEVDPAKPTIFKTVVSAPARRKGVASAMLDHARAIEPELQHSHALSEDAVAWAKRKP